MTITPTISELIHHIKRCPVDFLGEPVRGGKGDVYTEALVNDSWRRLSGNPVAPRRVEISAQERTVSELKLMQICCWALSHPFFAQVKLQWFESFFTEGLREIAPLVKSEEWVNDEERAEELARMLMHACNAVPAGETTAEAQDRFEAVNTLRRLKVIEESRAAIERAREIRRKMAEKKAREAANVYARE